MRVEFTNLTTLRARELEKSTKLMIDLEARRIVDLMPVEEMKCSEWLSMVEAEWRYGCTWEVARRVVELLKERRREWVNGRMTEIS